MLKAIHGNKEVKRLSNFMFGIRGVLYCPQICLYMTGIIFYSYTERDSKIGFGLPRNLSRIDGRKSLHIRNMDRLVIIDSRGFGQAENPIFESRSVYIASY